ncbi:DNA-directed DNA polymerase [Haloplanus litoreus]|uniref:DNA-directed DNA polymerase n=1 Tax=Haloplanus litoreus TaxID=767515 RepID=UPI00360D1086
MEQAELTGSWGTDDADRPEAEAVAVAGDAGQSVAEVVDTAELKFPDPDGTVDLAVTQIDYSVEGQGADEYPVVHVFGRTPGGDVEHVRVLGFEPYFYAPTASLSDDDLDRDVITRTETGYESIRGEGLTKICTRTPRDVGQIRDEFDHYEADILFPNRLLIDKDIESGVRVPVRRLESGSIQVPHDELTAVDVPTDLRVNTFDIEVDDRSGFPEEGEEPIVCLTSHDSGRDEYVAWLYDAPAGEAVVPDDLSDHDALSGDIRADVRAFDSEAAMLDAFLAYIEETDPDVLTGWNFEDFDAPYLIDRLEVVGSRPDVDRNLNPDRLSRIGEVWRSDWGGPTIKGRVVFDLLYAYKRTQFTELESYRLDAVGEQELGAGKERYTGDIGDLWENDPQRLLEYNLRDVELCVELDRKRDIISFWDEVRTFVGCKLEDAPTPGDAVDVYVLHKVHGDFALPSKGRADAEDYEGGAVFDPITGIKENVSVLDLKSLYPMCMVTINASPETKVDPETYDGDTYHAPNGTHFRKEPDGVIREMVDELLTEREAKKARRNENDPESEAYEQYDRQQQAVKVIMNSLYGVLGWDRFRLYDREMGAAVTATGRDVIEHTQTAANDVGYEVAYGDTDSVMLEIGSEAAVETVPAEIREAHPDASESDLRQIAGAIETGFELEERINESYDAFAREELNAAEHRFQIEFEKLYRRFFQAGKKKRYAGHIVWKEGKHVDDIDITGFEYKRSDIAPITKEVQRRVIEMIVTGDDVDDVEEYVHDVIEDFEAGNVDLNDVGIPGGIGKRLTAYDTDTAQVRGRSTPTTCSAPTSSGGANPSGCI